MGGIKEIQSISAILNFVKISAILNFEKIRSLVFKLDGRTECTLQRV